MSEALRTYSQWPPMPPGADADQRVVLHGVSWRDYETLLAIRGDDAGVRLTYLRGELELMSPSRRHEQIKKTIARLVEIYALERDIELEGAGSWTVKEELQERGAEPDECYFLRRPDGAQPERPDLALEVVHTSGGLDKLEVYRGLGVPEVWFWRGGGSRSSSWRRAATSPRRPVGSSPTSTWTSSSGTSTPSTSLAPPATSSRR